MDVRSIVWVNLWGKTRSTNEISNNNNMLNQIFYSGHRHLDLCVLISCGGIDLSVKSFFEALDATRLATISIEFATGLLPDSRNDHHRSGPA